MRETVVWEYFQSHGPLLAPLPYFLPLRALSLARPQSPGSLTAPGTSLLGALYLPQTGFL